MDELTVMLVAILGGIDVAMAGKPGGAVVSSSSSCRNANLWFFFFLFSSLFLLQFLVASSAFLSVTFIYAFFWFFFLIFSSFPLLSCPSPPLFRSPIPCSVIFLSCVSFPSLSLSLFPFSSFFYLSFSAPPVLSVFLSFPFCLQSLPFCLVFHPFLSRSFSGFIARECIRFPRTLLLK